MDNASQLWKNFLLNLPEKAFFELYRNYLGHIETPYNKQDMVASMENFLSQPEIIQAIVSRLSEDDLSVLTAVAFSRRTTLEDIQLYLKHRLSQVEISKILTSLRERLILFLLPGGEYVVTPPLYPSIEPYLSLTLLFSPIEEDVAPPEHVEDMLSSGLFLAIFRIILMGGLSRRKSGQGLKERSKSALRNAFNFEIVSIEQIFFVADFLVDHGIAVVENEQYKLLSLSHWQKLIARLKECDRFELFALLITQKEEQARFFEELLSYLTVLLRPNAIYTRKTLVLLIDYLCPVGVDFGASPEEFVNKLILLRFFVPSGEYYLVRGERNLIRAKQQDLTYLNADFELIVSEEVSISDGGMIPMIAELIKFDKVSHYKITEDVIRQAFVLGVSYENCCQILSQALQKEIPQSVAFILKSWYNNFRGALLEDGVMLTLDPQKSEVVDKLGLLEPFLIKKYDSYSYFLSRQGEEVWLDKLDSVDIHPVSQQQEEAIAETDTSYLISASSTERREISTNFPSLKAETLQYDASILAEQLESVKEQLEASDLDDLEKQLFLNRLERRIILGDFQLNREHLSPEKHVVKGFDLKPKVIMIQKAIDDGRYDLEVTFFEQTAKKTFKIDPLEVGGDKHNQEVRCRIEGESEPKTLPISRFLEIRLIEKSL